MVFMSEIEVIRNELIRRNKEAQKKYKLCDGCGEPTNLFNMWGNPHCELCQ